MAGISLHVWSVIAAVVVIFVVPFMLTIAVSSEALKPVLGMFVTDEAGTPIVKATVYFAAGPHMNVAKVTGREGLAHFGEIRTGTYRLCAMAQDFAEHCADVAHLDARAKTIVLTRVGR